MDFPLEVLHTPSLKEYGVLLDYRSTPYSLIKEVLHTPSLKEYSILLN